MIILRPATGGPATGGAAGSSLAGRVLLVVVAAQHPEVSRRVIMLAADVVHLQVHCLHAALPRVVAHVRALVPVSFQDSPPDLVPTRGKFAAPVAACPCHGYAVTGEPAVLLPVGFGCTRTVTW